MSWLEIKAYIEYCYMLYERLKMKKQLETEEVRWQILKAMLDEFPSLKKKVERYLKEQN